MIETQEPATLTSSLLVRKGEAAPTYYTVPPEHLARSAPPGSNSEPPLRRLWERISRATWLRGRETAPKESRPSIPSAPKPKPKRTRARTPETRARITIRLDENRHLRLRLTAAHQHDTLQTVLVNALDGYLEQAGRSLMNGDCACLDSGLQTSACSEPGDCGRQIAPTADTGAALSTSENS